MDEWEDDEWYDDQDEYLETCSYEDMYKGIFGEDPEYNELVQEISKLEELIDLLREKGLYVPRPYYVQYRPLPRNKDDLKRIIRNLINRILDCIWRIKAPEDVPDLYPMHPKKYKLKPAYSRYFVRKMAPYSVGQKLFPHNLTQVDLGKYDIEYLNFMGSNLSHLCHLELLKLEWLIESGKVKESDVIKMIRRDILQRPSSDPQLRKEVEDELIRYELSHKPEKQQAQLMETYRRYSQIMAERRKDFERQQQQLLADGLKRRKYIETLKHQAPFSSKQAKKKEELKISSAEMLCKLLSSKSRRGKEGK